MKKLFSVLIIIAFCWHGMLFAKEKPTSLDKMTVNLDWLINPDHAPLFIAQAKGFFKDQGLDVQLVRPPDINNPLRLLTSGKADLAVDYQAHLLLAISQSLPVVQVGTLIGSPLNCIAYLEKSGINTLKDLKGKRVGYAMSGVDTATIKGMLSSVDLTLDDISLIHIPHGLSQSLIAGKVDAITGIMRQFELTKLNLAGHQAKGFFPEEHGVPSYSALVFVALKKTMDEDKIKRFLTAVKAGVAYMDAHPQESWRIFAEEFPALDSEMIKIAWFKTAPLFARDPSEVKVEQCQKLVKFLINNLPPELVKPMKRLDRPDFACGR